jgi:high-affinity Fe2+/Pb2+ permease
MWHSGAVLSESSALGDVMHSFFGYSDAPTPLQLLTYVGYLAVVIVIYLGVPGRVITRVTTPGTTGSPGSRPGGAPRGGAGRAAA